MTQEVFARKLGISRPTLTRLESGAQNTTLATLDRISTRLGCPVADLFTMPQTRPEAKRR